MSEKYKIENIKIKNLIIKKKKSRKKKPGVAWSENIHHLH